MPIIDVSLVEGRPAEVKARLIRELTEVTPGIASGRVVDDEGQISEQPRRRSTVRVQHCHRFASAVERFA